MQNYLPPQQSYDIGITITINLYFREKETEAQRAEITYPSWESLAEGGLELGDGSRA